MEEDAGKSLHEGFPDSDRRTYLDYNRSGVPLIEIVSEPDMRSAAEAAEFFETLREILVWLGVNDGNMEEGSLRCDANVSVRPAGADDARHQGGSEERQLVPLSREGDRVRDRPADRRGRARRPRRPGDAAVGFGAAGGRYSMRSKEEAHDYRYFPEPDLPPLVVDAARIDARARARCPSCPRRARRGFVAQYAIPAYDAGVLTQIGGAGRLLRGHGDGRRAMPKAASNWIMGELLRTMKERGSRHRAGAADAGGAGRTDRARRARARSATRSARTCSPRCTTSGRSAEDDRRRRRARADRRRRRAARRSSATSSAANPDAVTQYRAGKQQTFGFLVGQVMKAASGKANPKLVSDLLKRELG